MTDTRDRSLGRACRVALVAALAAFASSAPAAAGTAVNTGYFDGVAIEGYDTVAYFTDGKATKGSEEFAYDWLGATWYSSTLSTATCSPRNRCNTRRNTAVTARSGSPSARVPPI
jgi:hypothetical protein